MSADHGLTGVPEGAAARAAGLIAVAEDLAGEFSLRPLLERILRRCTELLGCSAGSIERSATATRSSGQRNTGQFNRGRGTRPS